MNLLVSISVHICLIISLGKIPNSGIARSESLQFYIQILNYVAQISMREAL